MKKVTSLRKEKVVEKALANMDDVKMEEFQRAFFQSLNQAEQNTIVSLENILKLNAQAIDINTSNSNKLLLDEVTKKLNSIELDIKKFKHETNLNLDKTKLENIMLGNSVFDFKENLADCLSKQNELSQDFLIFKKSLLNSINGLDFKKEILDFIENSFNDLKKEIGKDISKIYEIIFKNENEVKTERTLSFQLGNEIISSGKSIKKLVNLPNKLITLRKEAVERKNVNKIRMIDDSVIKVDKKYLEVKSPEFPVQFKKLSDFVKNDEVFFNGSLMDHLGLKYHPSFQMKKDKNRISIKFETQSENPRYFQSDKLISLESIKDFIDDKMNLNFISTLEIVDLDFNFIVYFLDENKNRISLNFLLANTKLGIRIPGNCCYINFGIKILGNGSFSLSNIDIIDFKKKDDILIKKINLKKGISIVIPTYKAENTIRDTIKSIIFQKNIEKLDVEVLCVINGDLDNSANIISEYVDNNSQFEIKILYSDKGASAARNMGVENAKYEYLVFVDADDMISQNYLTELYDIANQNNIGICYINDLDSSGLEKNDTNINVQLKNSFLKPDYNNCSSAITMIASKIIPTKNAKKIRFNENLKSGEDVSYFSHYIDKFKPELVVVKDFTCAYIRRVTAVSVSRQPMSFDFNVEQRLDVIKEIEVNAYSIGRDISIFSMSKVNAQISFIIKYLESFPQDLSKVVQTIILKKFKKFPYIYFWKRLGKTEAEQLVFSYCHPPFVDTSATIVAKRVNEFEMLTDVISNDMSSNRQVDLEMMILDQHYINNLYFLKTPTSFGNWNAIKQYSKQGNNLVEAKKYKQVYSRVLWPASNFAALEYKIKNPDVKWIAEFSDPVVLDIEGNDRFAELEDKQWVNDLILKLGVEYIYLYEENNVYVWCELIAYLFADEIIFTCENQRKLMLTRFKYKEIAEIAFSKSVISPHPMPNKALYSLVESEYLLDDNFINIGYFGVFYKNRKLDDLIQILQQHDLNYKNVKIHLFTNGIIDVIEELTSLGVIEYFVVNNYLGYFEFLNICNDMDVLIVNDAKVSSIFGFNPYLPSKFSDYIGSNKPIWGFVENGSALQNMKNIKYKTVLGEDSSKIIDIIADCIKFKYGTV